MALEASDIDRRDMEYSTQFFDFTPDSFVDTISFSSTDIIEEELSKLRSQVVSKLPGKMTEKELDDCFMVVKDQYTEASIKVFGTFAKYLKKNILCIPKNIVLPEDKVHKGRTFHGDDLENSLKNVDNLCQQVRNAKYKRAILQAKLSNLQKVSLRQEKLLQEYNILAEQKKEMEALFDRQSSILQERLSVLRPQIEKLENNPTSKTPYDDRKRKIEAEKGILEKKARDSLEEDD